MIAARGVPWFVAPLCAFAISWSASARAAEGAPSTVAIWYRSGSECPDGEAFLSALQARAVQARLAQVGDAIDFVVTLGPSESGGMSGVLERQTETGTVAIRRVDDASCAQVAEALALTLALAVQSTEPAIAHPSPEPPPEPSPTAPSDAPRAESEPERAQPDRVAPTVDTQAADTPAGAVFALGIAGGFATGIAPALQPAGQLFFELERARPSFVRPALRVGALAAYGSGERRSRTLSVRVISGRLEASPVQLTAGALALRPWLAVELGQLQSEGDGASGRTDSGLWAASELSGHAGLRIAPALSIEAQLGLIIPLTRFELRSSDSSQEAAHQTAALALAARIGAIVHFP